MIKRTVVFSFPFSIHPGSRAMRKAESGFTLIELIVVIVILGILAVTAAAKFLNLTSDATSSVVKGLAGALRSSSSMVYAKSGSIPVTTGCASPMPAQARLPTWQRLMWKNSRGMGKKAGSA